MILAVLGDIHGNLPALQVALRHVDDEGIHTLVLCGAGRSFCGGFDLSGLDDETDASLAYRFLRVERLLQAVAHAPLYTVAVAHGPVSGAGADLVAACRRRIGSPDAVFRFPGSRFGVVLGTRRLRELLGPRAYSVVLEQKALDADRARQIGLLDQVAAADEWPELVRGIAERVRLIPETTRRQITAMDSARHLEDIGQLAESVAIPGLRERIRAYRETLKK